MPELHRSEAGLRAAMHGVRGVILDADGVLVLKGRTLPGATRGLRTLEEAGIPYRIVTNFSTAHRATLAARFSEGGLALDPAHIITSASAAAAYTMAAHPGRPLLVLAAPDALREFDGQRLVTSAEAEAAPDEVAAVVVGDAGDELTFADLDTAFRVARAGAELLAMHRNPWWLTARGVTLDSGALVAALEFALGRRARILGKPSPVVFRQAAAGLAGDLGLGRLSRAEVAMVGDDPRADLAPAHRLGMRTVLVLTGKTIPADAEAALRQARLPRTVVAPSVAEVVAALR